jgi:hypothetical protein
MESTFFGYRYITVSKYFKYNLENLGPAAAACRSGAARLGRSKLGFLGWVIISIKLLIDRVLVTIVT